MSERKIRLGRFDKWGYKNSFSKGELARELVYTNEDNDNLKQALNEIKEYVNSDKLLGRLCEPRVNNKGETHFELIRKDILQIIDKVDLGDK